MVRDRLLIMPSELGFSRVSRGLFEGGEGEEGASTGEGERAGRAERSWLVEWRCAHCEEVEAEA